jgi:Ca2+-transporting ATPase
VSILTLGSYFIGHAIAGDAANGDHGMTMAFLTMSMAEIFHSFNMRSQRGSIFTLRSQNWVLVLAGVGALLATTLVCEIPFLANAFGFASVGVVEYAIAIGLGLTMIPIVELVKLIQRAIAKRKDK